MAAIHGQLDGMLHDASGFRSVSDEQSGIMNRLGNTMEGLSTTFQGQAGRSMQELGEKMKASGLQRSQQFEDHSQKMSNNANMLQSKDEENSNILSQLANLD